MIFKTKHKTDFTIIPNKTINDSDLSLRSKGLLLYLLSKPDNWNVNLVQLSTVCNEGKSAIRTSLNELIDKGYINREQLRDKTGKMVGYQYDVYDTSRRSTVVRKTDDGKPASGKPDAGNRTLISTVANKKVITSNITTNVVKAKPERNEEVESIVTGFNKAFNVDHKQDRRAAQWFRQKYGVDVSLVMFTKTAQAQTNDKYCPRTPTLKDFWYAIPKLQDYFRRQEQNTNVTEITF